MNINEKRIKESIVDNKFYFLYKCVVIFILNFIIFRLNFLCKKAKRVGIISVRHNVNIGNNLVKYAISIKLKELGYIPYIIGTRKKKQNNNITFINQTTNLVVIQKTFKEIKKNDYDILTEYFIYLLIYFSIKFFVYKRYLDIFMIMDF